MQFELAFGFVKCIPQQDSDEVGPDPTPRHPVCIVHPISSATSSNQVIRIRIQIQYPTNQKKPTLNITFQDGLCAEMQRRDNNFTNPTSMKFRNSRDSWIRHGTRKFGGIILDIGYDSQSNWTGSSNWYNQNRSSHCWPEMKNIEGWKWKHLHLFIKNHSRKKLKEYPLMIWW